MPNHSIYALCEPGTLNVRYVGRTSGPIEKRVKKHCYSAKTAAPCFPLYDWIKTISMKPDAICLAQCPGNLAKEVERAWIILFIDNGYDMLNIKDCAGRGAKVPPVQGPEESSIGKLAKRYGLTEDELIIACRWAVKQDCSVAEALANPLFSFPVKDTTDAKP